LIRTLPSTAVPTTNGDRPRPAAQKNPIIHKLNKRRPSARARRRFQILLNPRPSRFPPVHAEFSKTRSPASQGHLTQTFPSRRLFLIPSIRWRTRPPQPGAPCPRSLILDTPYWPPTTLHRLFKRSPCHSDLDQTQTFQPAHPCEGPANCNRLSTQPSRSPDTTLRSPVASSTTRLSWKTLRARPSRQPPSVRNSAAATPSQNPPALGKVCAATNPGGHIPPSHHPPAGAKRLSTGRSVTTPTSLPSSTKTFSLITTVSDRTTRARPRAWRAFPRRLIQRRRHDGHAPHTFPPFAQKIPAFHAYFS